ncbi:HNH endonuclease signature motif containing protein [Winogradskya humida]|uniref:HNH nuclease domain-containing protein n=1 Tax=Winogradskya humida TaxID=113566 RepID=A0ABQ4A2V0_9ACTN|nr:HNH endonuclease signature motif containing protein [Actinoplanes humidus]GIE25176.1 hypothetical protein Ahu01nite_082780 [Actinoplanes humidus]
MAKARYTLEILIEAVTASTSIAGVMRHLGLPQNGGSHAHLRKRIDQLGIDTSHFLGQAHARGQQPGNRRRPEEVMVMRSMTAKREVPRILRRALIESGRLYQCTECGIEPTWNGRPLTLQVDHIDGCPWDCRPENLRFLCPNCHSQTDTFAGRHRLRATSARDPMVAVDSAGDPVRAAPLEPLDAAGRQEVVERVMNGELRPYEAAHKLGCSRHFVYKLVARLRERGSLSTAANRRLPVPKKGRTAIVAFALDHPELGAGRIAAEFNQRTADPIDVTPVMVARILTSVGLATRIDREAAKLRSLSTQPTIIQKMARPESMAISDRP